MTTTSTEQTDSQALLLQLLNQANRADPYQMCAMFRDRGPIQLADANLVVFSTYRDCDDVLRHPSSSSDRLKSTTAKRQIQALIEAGAEIPALVPPGFLFLDPPDHTRLRKLVSKAFAPKVVNALHPDVSALVDRVRPARHFRSRPGDGAALGVWAWRALLPGCAVGAAGSRGGPGGGGEAFSTRSAGQRAGVQDERHVARLVETGHIGLSRVLHPD